MLSKRECPLINIIIDWASLWHDDMRDVICQWYSDLGHDLFLP